VAQTSVKVRNVGVAIENDQQYRSNHILLGGVLG